jgi:hypothetical protein
LKFAGGEIFAGGTVFPFLCSVLGATACCCGACTITGDAIGGFTCGTAFQEMGKMRRDMEPE